MKCKVCGGTGTSNTCVNGTFKPCTFCDGTGEYEPFDLDVELDKLYPTEQTNEEYIRNCSTEELATMIYGIAVYDTLYDRIINIANPLYDDGTAGVKVVLEWLKEKHNV